MADNAKRHLHTLGWHLCTGNVASGRSRFIVLPCSCLQLLHRHTPSGLLTLVLFHYCHRASLRRRYRSPYRIRNPELGRPPGALQVLFERTPSCLLHIQHGGRKHSSARHLSTAHKLGEFDHLGNTACFIPSKHRSTSYTYDLGCQYGLEHNNWRFVRNQTHLPARHCYYCHRLGRS